VPARRLAALAGADALDLAGLLQLPEETADGGAALVPGRVQAHLSASRPTDGLSCPVVAFKWSARMINSRNSACDQPRSGPSSITLATAGLLTAVPGLPAGRPGRLRCQRP
jgi:hypothetical protein